MVKPQTPLTPNGNAHGHQGLWSQPNKFARPPGIEADGAEVTIHGYQEFKITPETIEPMSVDPPLRRKKKLVQVYFEREFLAGKTVLDIGANGGFFSLWAAQSGASEVVALDMDETYLSLIRQAQQALGWKQIRRINERVQNWEEPADLVLAFAMVHWLFSCTANFGSLEAVVAKLAGLSRSILLIEWVAPEDPAILGFKHKQWNPQVAQKDYNLEAFETALRKHFRKVEAIGPTSATRMLYVGCRQSHEVTLHPILPMLAPADHVIASRCLCEYKKTKYYSRVYADASPDRIIKQATFDMALHEAKILQRLQGGHFPKVISVEQRGGYSVLIMERIHGAALAESRAAIACDPKRLASFLRECVAILSQLRAASIRHRDIRLENLWVREGQAMLIDFGWAEAADEPYLNPGGLGGLERIPEGPTCDTYSMGRVFEQIIPQNSKLFAPLLQMMLNPRLARSLEIADLERVLNNLELPEAWDVPLVFPIPRQWAARPGAPLIKTGVLSAEGTRFWKRCRTLYHKILTPRQGLWRRAAT
jgi:SAM-dependent methyltransferase